ncbi:MAG: hypothetical protein AAF690_23840 [Acidobacteriota bacterium]
MSDRGRRSLLLAGGLWVVAWLLSAWISDDAFITYRTIDNALGGNGLRWNPDERVQSFTHPLWLFVQLPFVALTGRPALAGLAVSFALGLLTLRLLVTRVARSPQHAVVAIVLLAASRASLDYASSGLEDPLTRFLIVLLAVRLIEPSTSARRQAGSLALLAALGALCRPDALLFFLPALVWEGWQRRSEWPRYLSGVVLGFLPLLTWGIFAFVYFGFFLPNTAYAKLGMGVPRHGLLLQSFAYLADSLSRDPLTLAALLVAAASVWRGRERVALLLGAGAGLYLLFVLWIGGDYMSGRLLGSPLLLAALCLARYERSPGPRALRWSVPAAAALLVAGLASPMVTSTVGPYGVGDERRAHHPYTGLVYALTSPRWPEHSLRYAGEQARARQQIEVSGAIGLFGYYAGRDTTIVDIFGLSDPLLARLPGIVVSPTPKAGLRNWRPGHAQRPVPEGYVETLLTGKNQIADDDLSRYYDVLREAVTGPVFSVARWRRALGLQLGQYDELLDAYVERNEPLFRTFGPSSETLWAPETEEGKPTLGLQ